MTPPGTLRIAYEFLGWDIFCLIAAKDMGYLWLFVKNRDTGKINMGILQEIIKQACLLPETMMTPWLPPPSTPTYLYKP